MKSNLRVIDKSTFANILVTDGHELRIPVGKDVNFISLSLSLSYMYSSLHVPLIYM